MQRRYGSSAENAFSVVDQLCDRDQRATLHAVATSKLDSDSVWVVGDAGTILHSSNRGKSWQLCRLDLGEALTAVWSHDTDDAWIAGETHVFRIRPGPLAEVLSVELAAYWDKSERVQITGGSEREVWIANGSLRWTGDGGVTWARSTAPWPEGGCNNRLGDVAGGPETLWEVCDFAVRRSADGGRTWRATEWRMQTEEAVHVAVGPGDAWVIGRDSLDAGRTTDHGLSFVLDPLPSVLNRRAWSIWSGGSGWAWVLADGLWVRPGKPGWVRDLPRDLLVRVGGSESTNVWAVGARGLVLHRR